MAVILHIETSTPVCSVALSNTGILWDQQNSDDVNDHAAQLAVITKNLLDNNSFSIKNLNAVSVSAGPGSYTGLRIGASFAKGICHALQIPFIAVNSLQAMASGASENFNNPALLFAPLIDARRMEVYTAIYNSNLECIRNPEAVIMNSNDFISYLETNEILFFGSGVNKIKHVLEHPNSTFLNNFQLMANHQIGISTAMFSNKLFSDIAEFEPEYIKTFSGIARHSFDI
ncbi:MAG: tRNA (adenosine(37)-N6)-threonylcarbamoyltransferase complex dimerization subunit type 1 TsaB [Bacteroidetes bacterium]|nr:tRNA (adenosine(37)-N6)-threonylcarbamoyltransferase complex dimerization subunit type 1 TsaB [Bacteroidota bacterium]MBK7108250.1 tRNA (adenosine(37)-N6)-threonylcarbamoyltransferase complex dimerization subunit type 1 TsaB [Bacteroidota bacterium]MBK8486325.1 tRNA (adenosine(37)-N6)-threonylcarbamoyltransferase complex dimerization subunit type 1 TsaB [Bacteroidota bacterium]MBK8683108.1 tRNA (adenosine(37)-N6)-threonylcarbamoyltransferase complex dimerization subunit type 1 TsaB [Bacteroid